MIYVTRQSTTDHKISYLPIGKYGSIVALQHTAINTAKNSTVTTPNQCNIISTLEQHIQGQPRWLCSKVTANVHKI